jgi:hypothetical protein
MKNPAKQLTKYFIEFTDTYGGEANYCWARRYNVDATSYKNALTKAKQFYFGNASGYPHRITGNYGDMLRADFQGMAVCCFVSHADEFNAQYDQESI